ncbi:helix-turn-helix domain-containing protein [Paenibacillus dauci]|uniref:helix-turn-helix domain-containing protein n=1 Tax=Paenibacillus dauci TaxID=1567106 RepID=UPI0006976CD8|nr:AraC family transcriptional regulator [Paenibacillus dauci]
MNTEFMIEHDIDLSFPAYSSLHPHKWTLLYAAENKETLDGPTARIYLLPPGKIALYLHLLPLTEVCCQFTAHSQWTLLLHKLQTGLPEQPLWLEDCSLCQQIAYILERMREYAASSHNTYYRKLSYHLLSELLLLLAAGARPDTYPADPRIDEVLQYLYLHYTNDIRIEHLAQHVCLSPSHLSHLYKEQTGETIMDTVLRLRLEQAKHLLCFTTRYIGEIAYEVGFNSQTYFTCKFTRHFGISPSLYRSSFYEKQSCQSS